MNPSWTVHLGDALAILQTLPENSIHCCVTSPPYWGLRDYKVEGQMGLEETPQAFILAMTALFRELRRVLRPDGTLWVNMGDSYAGGRRGGHPGSASTLDGSPSRANRTPSRRRDNTEIPRSDLVVPGLKAKSLLGMPWRLAFALQDDGWILRQDIIWSKPNAMPEQGGLDRCTKSHEYLFLLAKNERYFFNGGAIQEPATGTAHARSSAAVRFPGANERDENRRRPGVTPKALKVPSGWDTGPGRHGTIHRLGRAPRVRANPSFSEAVQGLVDQRQKRSVWTIPTQPYPEAHFATYPEALVEPCILAGCPPGGTVLDPFTGSGTTGAVARRLGRSFIGIELSPEYHAMALRRINAAEMGLPELQEGA